jgi:signal transduction histidine kinase
MTDARLRRIAIGLALLAGVLAGGCGKGAGSLPEAPDRLHYLMVTAAPISEYSGTFEAVDLDGDGIDEEIKYDDGIGGASFLSVARVRQDQLYHLYTRHLLSKGGVLGVTDITGDGRPELIWWRQESSETVGVLAEEVRVHEASADLVPLHLVELPTEGSTLPDGRWAASLHLVGVYDRDGDGATDAVAMGVNAGITLAPREIIFWDFNDDSIGWRVRTGATPTGGSAVADLNADGRPELVIGLEAPGNGATAGEWDDSHSYVLAIGQSGGILWSHELGGFSSSVELTAADLDGDGTLEVLTAINYHSELDHTFPELAVWRGSDGALMDSLRVGHPVNVVLAEQCDIGMRVFAGSSDGMLRRLAWKPGAFTIERTLDCGGAVEGLTAAEFLPEVRSSCVVAATGKGEVAVLDRDLSPLAETDIAEAIDGGRRLRATEVETPDGAAGGVIVRTQSRTRRYFLTPRPLALWIKLLVPGAGVILSLVLVPASRRATLALLRRSLLAKDTRDDAVEQLLSALATAGHGKLTATSTLRRLSRQAEMIIAHDGDVPEAFGERFTDAVSNARDVGLPGLDSIARLALRVGIAPEAQALLTSEIERLETILAGLPEGLPGATDAESLMASVDGATSRIDRALGAIKLHAESERSSSLGSELGRALLLRREQLDGMGVRLSAPDPSALRSARVLGTPQELSFVLDNVLGNALAAMESTRDRRLDISVELGPQWVTLRIEDTGNGIPASMQEQIFVRGVSDRAGGGYGLPASREMLGRRGGTIELARSVPGEGTTFELRLRLLRVA